MDNRYFSYGCPCLLQDARFITNYKNNRIFEQEIRNINKINSAQDYKYFLQQNSDVIMKREQDYLVSTNKCDPQLAIFPYEKGNYNNNMCHELSILNKSCNTCKNAK